MIDNHAIYQHYTQRMVLDWMLGNLKDNIADKLVSPLPCAVVKGDMDLLNPAHFKATR